MNKYLKQPVWDFFLGIGLGGQTLMTLDWVKRFGARHITLDPHNDLLLLLFQIGPFGVLCYLAIQWKVYKVARAIHAMAHADRFARNLATFAAALTAMVFVTNAISNSFIHRTSPGWFYWCVCGLMFAEYADLKKQAAVAPIKIRAVPAPAAISAEP
jgi:O-antigen ligase